MVFRRLFRPVCIAVLAGFVGAAVISMAGCDAASASGDAIGSAVDAIGAAFRAGKTDRFSNVSVEDSIAATKAMGDELNLTFVRVVIHPDQQKIEFKDDRGQHVVCTLIRRAGRITEIRVDVGLFGPEGFGKLVLDRILMRLGLSPSATRPALSAEA